MMNFKSVIAAGARSLGYSIVRRETLGILLEHSRRLAEIEEHSAETEGLGGDMASPSGIDDAGASIVPVDDNADAIAEIEDVEAWTCEPLQPSSACPAYVVPADEALSAEAAVQHGVEARRQSDDDLAFRHFARALALIPRYAPAVTELIAMSSECLDRARGLDLRTALPFLVRAVEMNPMDQTARTLLAEATDTLALPDLTQQCFIFHDADRAREIHGEAYRRSLEYVTLGGIVGDILEFGVLGGWSARILCETMRDLYCLGNIHLFDSFEGLPEYDSEIDRSSYEVGGRNIWADKMKFPDDFLEKYEGRHDLHIRDQLSQIIRRERIFINRGFYSNTLKDNLPIKASIVHIDCDLYQSTAEVLWGLHRMKALQDGCVLIFDDWNCNRASPNFGERRAFAEFMEGQNDFEATRWFSYGYNGMTFIIHAASA